MSGEHAEAAQPSGGSAIKPAIGDVAIVGSGFESGQRDERIFSRVPAWIAL